MNRHPSQIILRPVLSEKSEILKGEGKYAFFVAPEANKIEIKDAIEELYNEGKKKKDRITVEKVHVIKVRGKQARRGFSSRGKRPDRKKAIVTLAAGDSLEEVIA